MNQFLNGLEDIGVDGLPADMEIDLRHIMNIDSPSVMTSRFLDIDDDDLDDDLLEPFGLSPEDCGQMSQFFRHDSDDLKSEPFMLLPDMLSLNKEGLEGEEDKNK